MKRFLLAIAAILLVGATYGIYCLHRVVTVVVPNAYATDWSAAMVIEYLKTHDNNWPQSWDDLREPYETLAAPQNCPWSFDEMKRRIMIDWTADPETLRIAASIEPSLTVKVIWLADGSHTHWQGAEPNQRILEYLRSLDTPIVDANPP